MTPKNFMGFRDDAVLVVGVSDSKRDWPYVHPGPSYAWAGGCPHTFAIVFGLKQKPPAENCRLLLYLLETHDKAPARLRMKINGQPF